MVSLCILLYCTESHHQGSDIINTSFWNGDFSHLCSAAASAGANGVLLLPRSKAYIQRYQALAAGNAITAASCDGGTPFTADHVRLPASISMPYCLAYTKYTSSFFFLPCQNKRVVPAVEPPQVKTNCYEASDCCRSGRAVVRGSHQGISQIHVPGVIWLRK